MEQDPQAGTDLEHDGRHREDHGLVEHGVVVVPLHRRLLLADLPPVLQQVDLDEGICSGENSLNVEPATSPGGSAAPRQHGDTRG